MMVDPLDNLAVETVQWHALTSDFALDGPGCVARDRDLVGSG